MNIIQANSFFQFIQTFEDWKRLRIRDVHNQTIRDLPCRRNFVENIWIA